MALFRWLAHSVFVMFISISTQASPLKNYIILNKGHTSVINTSPVINNSRTIAFSQQESMSEKDIFIEELHYIFNHGSIRKGSLINQLRKAYSTSLDESKINIGLGHYTQLILPLAIELTASCQHQENERRYTIAPSLKAYIPLSASLRCYAQVGKSFYLHSEPSEQPIASADTLNGLVSGIEENILKKSPQEQWIHSQTFCGVGLLQRLSSRLECNVSITGYTTRDRAHLYFVSAIGFHYLWS